MWCPYLFFFVYFSPFVLIFYFGIWNTFHSMSFFCVERNIPHTVELAINEIMQTLFFCVRQSFDTIFWLLLFFFRLLAFLTRKIVIIWMYRMTCNQNRNSNTQKWWRRWTFSFFFFILFMAYSSLVCLRLFKVQLWSIFFNLFNTVFGWIISLEPRKKTHTSQMITYTRMKKQNQATKRENNTMFNLYPYTILFRNFSEHNRKKAHPKRWREREKKRANYTCFVFCVFSLSFSFFEITTTEKKKVLYKNSTR